MATFYMAMARSGNARKLYVQVWLICLLLFHYVYACGHMGEFGILLSTGVCAAMFSFYNRENETSIFSKRNEQKLHFFAPISLPQKHRLNAN